MLLQPTVETVEDRQNFQFTLPVASQWYVLNFTLYDATYLSTDQSHKFRFSDIRYTLFMQRSQVSIAPDAHLRAMGYHMTPLALTVVSLLALCLWLSEAVG